MANGKLIVICQSGGKFTSKDDSSLSYTDGDAHAMSVSKKTLFNEFKSEIAEMWKYDSDSMIIKYFLPNNKRTLITISSDKDIQRLFEFHEDSTSVDVYVMRRETVASDVSNMPSSRSIRTTVAEPVTPVDAPTAIKDIGQQSVTRSRKNNIMGLHQEVKEIGQQRVTRSQNNRIMGLHQEVKEIGRQRVTRSLNNRIMRLHQQFNSVHDFRDALRMYSIAHGFAYKFENNDRRRVTAKCKAEGCPWRVNASKLSTTQLFKIMKMNKIHTCGAGTDTANRPRATEKLVASIVMEKLRETPNYKPKEIVNDIRQDLGIEVPYSMAWRGIKIAKEDLQGSYEEAYNHLPWLCKKLVETNPGSVATLITRDDLSFHRMFIAFHASLYGFQSGCRPLLFLDTMPLQSRYQGELLTATTVDGNGEIFPVAFAIVDVVSDDNWNWFLVQLKSVLSTSQSITIVADRENGISESISKIFKDCYHGHCLHHLMESLKKDLEGACAREVISVIVARFYDAAYAPTLEGFKKCAKSIKDISPEAYEWILQSDPEHWANAFFKGARDNHVTSNIAEAFYSWVSKPPGLPITQIIDTMCRKMMEMINTRRVDSDQWSTRLTPSSEDKLQTETLKAHPLEVLSSSSSTFEVRDDLGTINVVNIDHYGCSCREWQILGLPCSHALAVLERMGKNIYDYCSKLLMTETYWLMYSESINPIPAADMPVNGDFSSVQLQRMSSYWIAMLLLSLNALDRSPYDYCFRYFTTDRCQFTYSESTHHVPNVDSPLQKELSQIAVAVNPPPNHCLPDRPKLKQTGAQDVVRHQLQCNRCKGVGHNKLTCK
ncbi:hypothetical protein HHK36_020958 [Tetracentron sinense]|uniref:SWIM-type domain-containing protein n=1 Tax=Tetracentron sinense TaxID=13715 RepID=A0A835D9B0_TETSI|nr:hypothetical protein HHK36_020958 [Tetracentron sinense]